MGRLLLVSRAEVKARSRSPSRRGRSPSRRGRSPSLRGRSPSLRGRSPSCGRSRGRGAGRATSWDNDRGRGQSNDSRGGSRSRGRSEESSWSELEDRSWNCRKRTWKDARDERSWSADRRWSYSDEPRRGAEERYYGKADRRWDSKSGWEASSRDSWANEHATGSSTSRRRQVFYVGVAGPSGAGKTTLARKLAVELGSPLGPIGMDWFLEPKRMPKDPVHGKNWETPQGVDYAGLREALGMIGDVFGNADAVPDEFLMGAGAERGSVVRKGQAGKALGSDPVFVIAEGFLLFYDDALAEGFGARIWVEADCETCLKRRHQRGKASKKRDVEEMGTWFRDLVWATYVKHRKPQIANAGKHALRIDGTSEKADVAHEASAYCWKMLRESDPRHIAFELEEKSGRGERWKERATQKNWQNEGRRDNRESRQDDSGWRIKAKDERSWKRGGEWSDDADWKRKKTWNR